MTVAIVLMFGLLAAAFMCLYRVAAGPTAADRTVAVDILGTVMIGFCALLSVATGNDLYMIVGISWALLAFVVGLALAKHLEGRSFDD